MNMTIKEFATSLQLSTQYVYKLVATNQVKSIKKNGRRYVVVDDSESIATNLQPKAKEVAKEVASKVATKPVNNTSEDMVKYLKKELKKSNKENKRLTLKLEKCTESKEQVLLTFIDEMKQLKLISAPVSPAPIDEDIIDIKESKKKKNKKKSKNKKKRK